MKTIKAVQYIARFEFESEAKECCANLAILEGCLMTRAFKKDEYPNNNKNWVAQGIFKCEKDVNPEAFDSHYGMRVVNVPLSFLVKND